MELQKKETHVKVLFELLESISSFVEEKVQMYWKYPTNQKFIKDVKKWPSM